jgi:hypothetical protein
MWISRKQPTTRGECGQQGTETEEERWESNDAEPRRITAAVTSSSYAAVTIISAMRGAGHRSPKKRWLERDSVRAICQAAEATCADAQRQASSRSASLDSQARRAEAVLLRTYPREIDEFLEVVRDMLSEVTSGKIFTTSQVDGYRVDGRLHKQDYSTFQSAGERADVLVAARRAAESLRTAPLSEEQVEARLAEIYATIPGVEYRKT